MPDDAPTVREALPSVADEVIREGVALGINPETEGKLIQASAKTGYERELLREQQSAQVEDFMKRDARMRAYQNDVKLAAWVATHPSYADVSRDDEIGLMRVRAASDSWKEMMDSAPTTSQKWTRPALEVGGGIAKGIVGLGRAAWGALSFASDLQMLALGQDPEEWTHTRVLKELAELSDAQKLKADFHGVPLRAVQKQDEILRRSVPDVFGVTPGDVAGGFTSLAPTLVAGAATGGALWAVIAAAGLQSTGGMYADLREDGKGYAESAVKAAAAGAITAGLTRIFPTAEKGIASLLRGAVDKKAAARLMFSSVLGKRAAGEMAEEGLDEFAQALLRGDSLAEAVDAGIKAGIIGGIIGGAVGVGEARSAHRLARADATEEFHSSIDNLVRAIDASKTMERSPEVMKSFLQSAHPELKNAPAVFAADELQTAMQDPQVAEHLAAIGITADTVGPAAESGGIVRTTQEKVLLDLPAETREKIRPLMRESADAMSRPEAELVREVAKATGSSAIDESAKRTLKAIQKEKTRLAREITESSRQAIIKEDAMQAIDLMVQQAYTVATRDASAGATALASLRKVVFRGDDKLTDFEVRHRATRLAGKGGKTALQGIRTAHNLGQVAARVDLLTGQITINPSALTDQRQVDAILKAAQGKTLDLTGKTVPVTTENGSERVDAAMAVGMIRDRIEQSRRLLECLQ